MSSLDQNRVLTVDGGLVEDEIVTLITEEEPITTITTTTPSSTAIPTDSAIDFMSAEVLDSGSMRQSSSQAGDEQLTALLSLTNHVSSPAANDVAVGQSSPVPAHRQIIKRDHNSTTPLLNHLDAPLDNITMSLTPEGLVVTADGGQRRFFINSEQLAVNNIDINNLNEDSIHQVISLAFSTHQNEKCNEMKKRKVENNQATTLGNPNQLRCEVAIHEDKLMGHSVSPSTSTRKLPLSEARSTPVTLIGEEIEVKRNGRLVPAKIRYCRGGRDYKVQFSDGHFEWVGSDQIRARAGTVKIRNDHKSYSGGLMDPAGFGRRVPPSIPGIKVTPQNGYERSGEPNFCCVVCDRKLYQKEVKFLTIRVPACDECTQLKMLVMDTVEEYRDEQQKQPAAVQLPPDPVSDTTAIAQEVDSSPRIPDELLEAPPILHRLDSPNESGEATATVTLPATTTSSAPTTAIMK